MRREVTLCLTVSALLLLVVPAAAFYPEALYNVPQAPSMFNPVPLASPVPFNGYPNAFDPRQQMQMQMDQIQGQDQEEDEAEEEGQEESGGYSPQFREVQPNQQTNGQVFPPQTPAGAVIASPPSNMPIVDGPEGTTDPMPSGVILTSSSPPTVQGKCSESGECVDAEMRLSLRSSKNPTAAKMESELEDIRQAIVLHTRSITNEENWINNVQEIMKLYSLKIQKVQEHIVAEHRVIKELMKRRHEIRTKQKGDKLEKELKAASTDLNTLQAELSQVKDKEDEFNKNREVLKQKITELSSNLDKLKGTSSGSASGK